MYDHMTVLGKSDERISINIMTVVIIDIWRYFVCDLLSVLLILEREPTKTCNQPVRGVIFT